MNDLLIPRRTFLRGAFGAGAALTSGEWRRSVHRVAERFGLPPDPFDVLRRDIAGSLILPSDPLHNGARRVWSFNPTTDKRPAVIVHCAGAADVQRSVRFAREHGLEIAVRSGGHDILGASVCEGGLVIDLSQLRGVDVDPAARRARLQPGARSGDVSRAAYPHDLVAVLGCNPAVGVGGLLLGGAFGFFLGRLGAGVDQLHEAQVVLADGSIVTANANEHPDLFWAIRGGGGNFGVVTSFDVRLHPIDAITAGVVAYRTKDLPAFLRAYRDYMAAAPDPLVVELSVFPERDATGIWAMACWNGSEPGGAKALEPLRSFAPVTADTIEHVPLVRMFSRMPAREGPSGPAPSGPPSTYWRGGTVSGLSDEVIDRLSSSLERAPRGCQLGLGHALHGQVCRADPAETPLVRVAGRFTYFVSESWVGDGAERMAWVDATWASVEGVTRTPTYVNYLSVNSDEAVRATYGRNYDRLARIKREYDASNAFHFNRNILPATS